MKEQLRLFEPDNDKRWWAYSLETSDDEVKKLFFARFGFLPVRIERDNTICRCLIGDGNATRVSY